MELSFSELKKREVINVADGSSLGNVVDVTFIFPQGILAGITVPGKKGCFLSRLFNRNQVYVDKARIIKIGGDVILVDLKCGDFCYDSENFGGKGMNTYDKKPKNPCNPCNIGISKNEVPNFPQSFGEGEDY